MRGGIFSTSLGHKLVMSITGLFLMVFLLVHMTINLALVLNDVHMFGTFWAEGEMYNTAAHFMISTPLIRIMEPLLAAGFVFHIIYGVFISIRNSRHRPIRYAKRAGNPLTTWPSKNMLILGLLVLAFLVLHIINFFWKFRYGEMPLTTVHGVEMDDSYLAVSSLFRNSIWYCVIYIASAVLLGLHLAHGFWSAFQTIGFNNLVWVNRLRIISLVYAVIIAGGFSLIPIYFMIF